VAGFERVAGCGSMASVFVSNCIQLPYSSRLDILLFDFQTSKAMIVILQKCCFHQGSTVIIL
jgi:hypothetical protein